MSEPGLPAVFLLHLTWTPALSSSFSLLFFPKSGDFVLTSLCHCSGHFESLHPTRTKPQFPGFQKKKAFMEIPSLLSHLLLFLPLVFSLQFLILHHFPHLTRHPPYQMRKSLGWALDLAVKTSDCLVLSHDFIPIYSF